MIRTPQFPPYLKRVQRLTIRPRGYKTFSMLNSAERIMSDALEEHDKMVSIGSRNITNLWFADNWMKPAQMKINVAKIN